MPEVFPYIWTCYVMVFAGAVSIYALVRSIKCWKDPNSDPTKHFLSAAMVPGIIGLMIYLWVYLPCPEALGETGELIGKIVSHTLGLFIGLLFGVFQDARLVSKS